MSLISQQDRQMAIEALEYYVEHLKKDNCTQASINSFQTLLNWIELEHFKHEDSTVVL
jgi:regulator of sirC expression with transglutaminase-like and TPR domain